MRTFSYPRTRRQSFKLGRHGCHLPLVGCKGLCPVGFRRPRPDRELGGRPCTGADSLHCAGRGPLFIADTLPAAREPSPRSPGCGAGLPQASAPRCPAASSTIRGHRGPSWGSLAGQNPLPLSHPSPRPSKGCVFPECARGRFLAPQPRADTVSQWMLCTLTCAQLSPKSSLLPAEGRFTSERAPLSPGSPSAPPRPAPRQHCRQAWAAPGARSHWLPPRPGLSALRVTLGVLLPREGGSLGDSASSPHPGVSRKSVTVQWPERWPHKDVPVQTHGTGDVTLFGKEVFADAIKVIEMRLSRMAWVDGCQVFS